MSKKIALAAGGSSILLIALGLLSAWIRGAFNPEKIEVGQSVEKPMAVIAIEKADKSYAVDGAP